VCASTEVRGKQPQLRDDSIAPEGDDGSEEDASHAVGGKLVVSSCNTAPVLEPAPEAFDEVAGAVGLPVVGDGGLAASGWRDDDLGALCSDRRTNGVAVVAAIGQQPIEP